MQKDFHYDLIYLLFRKGGYNENDSSIIAYASQYVDDNTEREYTVSDSHGSFYVGFPEKVGNPGSYYFPIITQSVDLTAFKLSTQRYVYAPFHFIPGDNNVEIKKGKNPLCTTRGCQNATVLLQSAVKSKDCYRIGVAAHTYADTWSHERFSAFHEDWNKTAKINVPPSIGHAQEFHKPDEISTSWADNRFGKDKIDNKGRALLAAEAIFGYINKSKAKWNDARKDLEKIIDAENSVGRVKLIKDLVPEIPHYEEDKWFNEALKFSRDVSDLPEPGDVLGGTHMSRPKFVECAVKDRGSHWFKFQDAAKTHLSQVQGMIKEL